jgi:hypothetical protein
MTSAVIDGILSAEPGRPQPPARSVVELQSGSRPVRRGIFAIQTKNMEYAGCGSSWTTMARPMAMTAATMPSMRSVPCPWRA